MQPRKTILAVAVACLLGSASWWLFTRSEDIVVAPPAPSADVVADGTLVPVAPADNGERAAVFPIMRATTPAEVREVLRITKAATSQDRPALLDAALHAADPLVAGSAVKALGRLHGFTSEPALLALVTDPRLRVRQDAVTACGLDGRAAAIPHLERALATSDAALRPLVLEALGRIGGATARALVQRVAADPDAARTDRVFARAALERMPSEH